MVLFYLHNNFKNYKKRENSIIISNTNSQKTIQQMIHDIKNPLATLAMAIHNLQCSNDLDKKMGSEDLFAAELYDTINESLKDTTYRLD